MTSQRVIGRYEVKSKIARGGMATVYHAYDPRFERDVAIKVLPEAFLHDPQFRVRFEREAKMIALLEHPAIVPVYDFGEHDGMPYIVMRYMSGGSLTERLKPGPMSLAETAQMVFRLAPALDAAHARSIIHRDLKPGNILFDQYGNAYLSDFGIARLVQGGSATLTGESILGTPAFMSPEQVQGDKSIDGRSDLYSLGVLIYQMLTGKAPYEADTAAKVMMMHVLQPPPSILGARPDLPAECEALIHKAMAKNPDERFGSASELSTALEAAMRSAPGGGAAAGASGGPSASPTLYQDAAHRPDFQMPTAATPGETRLGGVQTVVGAPATVVGAGPAGGAGNVPPGRAGAVSPAERPARRPRSGGLGWLIPLAIGVILLLAVGGGLAWMGTQGRGPLAMLGPSPTLPPTATLELPSATPAQQRVSVTTQPVVAAASDTPAPTVSPAFTDTPAASNTPAASETPTALPGGPVIGGADKVAYLNANDIWIANLDGTQVEQLTSDNTLKSNLQWSPDGQSVNYLSGKCAYAVHLADKQKEILTCINFVQYFKSFEISPDGKQVAMSLDNQLYVLPYDLNVLRSISVRNDLTKLATCADFSPYLRFFVKFPRWGKDGRTMATVIMGNAKGIGSADLIQAIDFTQCTADPKTIDTFPATRFTPPEYALAPMIINFGWDGLDLFTFATYIRNQGFGKLYVYNSDLKKAQGPLGLVGECCYRDPVFTPDGSQILFAYQKYPGGDGNIQLYLVPYGTLGTGQTYTPIALPPIDPKTQPVPALRPVK